MVVKINNGRVLIVMVVILLLVCCGHCGSGEDRQILGNNNSEQLPMMQEGNLSMISENLLAIERQITMSKQMIRLYEQRMEMLYKLRHQYKIKELSQKRSNKAQQESSPLSEMGEREASKVSDSGEVINKESSSQSFFTRQRMIDRGSIPDDSPYYTLLDVYQLRNKRDIANNEQLLQDEIIILPPFAINKLSSYVTLITQLNNFQSQRSHKQPPIDAYYDFSHANRLLFYSKENDYVTKRNSKLFNEVGQQQRHVLQLALEIKPNKVKVVKITYYQKTYTNNVHNSNNTSTQNSNNTHYNNFIIDQHITPYQSHPVINSHFQWHKALQFDNLIIGYANTTIYIKGKQKSIQSIDVHSTILGLYSINQYKLIYVTEKNIGIVNVRSYLIGEEIWFQYYLGNNTVIKNQKKQQQQQEDNNQYAPQQQTNILHGNQPNNSYWHQPYTKQFNQISAISVTRIQPSGELLILLSNGDLLLHINSRIVQSINLGVQLMKQLPFYYHSENNNDQNNQEVSFKDGKSSILTENKDMKITMDVVPNYNYLIISSNRHEKVLIYNITIPHLSVNRETNFFAFLSPKANELTSSYWMAVDLHRVNVDNKIMRDSNNDLHTNQFSIVPYFPSSSSKSSKQQSIIIYFTYQQSPPSLITIQHHRLLINLLQNSHITGVSSYNNSVTSSEGSSRSYWWNILMIVMIVLGVVLFRRCNRSRNKQKSKQQQYDQMFQIPEEYTRHKQGKSINSNKMKSYHVKQTQPLYKQPQPQQHYEDQVITELQSYLLKQGQKLTKQQISLLIQDIQSKQEKQQQQLVHQQKMKRQSPLQTNEYQLYGSKQKHQLNEEMHKLQGDSVQKKKKKKT